MEAAWKTLLEAGLPEGLVRVPPATVDLTKLGAAVAVIAAHPEAISPDRREPLLAWLRAWRSHWGESFQRIVGTRCDALLVSLEEGVDENRYLKLRRIAIENLAGIL